MRRVRTLGEKEPRQVDGKVRGEGLGRFGNLSLHLRTGFIEYSLHFDCVSVRLRNLRKLSLHYISVTR